MEKYVLECCVDSVESAIAAQAGGATRIELCSALVIGGLTPSKALFERVRSEIEIPIHVLIRPRFGDFCYTTHEHEIIKEEIRMFRELGADGVVIGSLTPEGSLDMERMSELMECAKGMSVTLHRAFDVCKKPLDTLHMGELLGIHTILTSGQKNICSQGIELLAELTNRQTKVEILVGGGVDSSVIPQLYLDAGITAFHMSGKEVLDSEMEYRKEGVNMGVASMSEYQIWRTSEERIATAKRIIEAL